jgi:hypothetical protein
MAFIFYLFIFYLLPPGGTDKTGEFPPFLLDVGDDGRSWASWKGAYPSHAVEICESSPG